jgi:hypothetical protein
VPQPVARRMDRPGFQASGRDRATAKRSFSAHLSSHGGFYPWT